MKLSTIITLATSSLAAASPLAIRQQPAATTLNSTQPFYLLTTTCPEFSSNSSLLPNVSLTALFSPYYQPNYLLRLIAPGYGSVPTFTLSDGTLHTPNTGPHGIGNYIFNSTEIQTGSELQFRAQVEGEGDLSLVDGYLLAVNGTTEGWSVCVEELGQRVVEWMGTDESCEPTYIQAAVKVPY